MTNDDRVGRNALIVRQPVANARSVAAPKPGASRLFGSLRDALLAAGREPAEVPHSVAPATTSEYDRAEPTMRYAPPQAPAGPSAAAPDPAAVSLAALVRDPRESQRALVPARDAPAAAPDKIVMAGRVPVEPGELAQPLSPQAPRTQPVARAQGRPSGAARTQMLRGRQKVSRASFHQDPVVGWLVIVGGPGLGAHRSIFEGNNTVGRASTQRIPIDFGDDTISSEEQAYIRYDSNDRSFLFVPNLAKTNVVQVNDQKPTGAVALQPMDVITMGRTQLVFVPFCGAEFDWAELSDVRE